MQLGLPQVNVECGNVARLQRSRENTQIVGIKHAKEIGDTLSTEYHIVWMICTTSSTSSTLELLTAAHEFLLKRSDFGGIAATICLVESSRDTCNQIGSTECSS